MWMPHSGKVIRYKKHEISRNCLKLLWHGMTVRKLVLILYLNDFSPDQSHLDNLCSINARKIYLIAKLCKMLFSHS